MAKGEIGYILIGPCYDLWGSFISGTFYYQIAGSTYIGTYSNGFALISYISNSDFELTLSFDGTNWFPPAEFEIADGKIWR